MKIIKLILLVLLLPVLLVAWPVLFPRTPSLTAQCQDLLVLRYAIALEMHNAQDEGRREDMRVLLARGEELLARCEELGWRQP